MMAGQRHERGAPGGAGGGGGATAGRRRARLGAMALALVAAATGSAVLLSWLGTRTAVRVDLTATGEHRLSPRTAGVVAGLAGGVELVLAGPLRDAGKMDPRAVERVRDVLGQIERAGRGRVRVTAIDTGSARGAAEYEALLSRLVEREGDRAGRAREGLASAAEAAGALAESMDALATRLLEIRALVPEAVELAAARTYLQTRAGESGASARALRELSERARSAVDEPTGGVAVPDVERVSGMLRGPLSDLRTGLDDIARNLSALSAFGAGPGQAELPESTRAMARVTGQSAGDLRDRASRALDGLDRLPRLDVLRVARVLERQSALLVIGPAEGRGSGLTAVAMEDLMPALGAGEVASAEVGRNAEELVGSALASLSEPNKPIVVVMHGQSRGFFDRVDLLSGLRRRLMLRGMDVVLWETLAEAEPPALTRLDPSGTRPVVYVALNTANFAGGGRPGESGPERVSRLGAAIRQVVDRGEPLLLNLYPNTGPTFGEVDPTAAVLPEFGLSGLTGRVVLRERSTPEGRRVEAWQRLTAVEGSGAAGSVGGAILGAVRGLPTRFEWPVAIEVGAGAERVGALYRVEEAGSWNESQWLSFIQVPIAQHAGVPDPPRRDARDQVEGPFVVAVAAERPRPSGSGSQRLVVVGSNSWFLTPVLEEAGLVDGRVALSNPGNAELLEASVYWLAGQEGLIGASATARAAPLVGAIDAGVLSLLRMGAVVVLPGGVLVLGLLWRWWRG